jgi:hypothetical protein
VKAATADVEGGFLVKGLLRTFLQKDYHCILMCIIIIISGSTHSSSSSSSSSIDVYFASVFIKQNSVFPSL